MLRRLTSVATAVALMVTGFSATAAHADTQSGVSWALDRIDQSGRALNGTYQYNDSGVGTNIYVVDSGISTTHTDLFGRVGAGVSLLSGQPSSSDCFGTGTAVASVAAGKTYGVAKNATVVPVRAFDCNGVTSLKTLTKAVNWVTAHRDITKGAVILLNTGNLMGKYAPLSTAVSNALKKKIAVIVPAGDRDRNPCAYSPYNVAGAIVVGATDVNDARAQFAAGASNLGACVDVWAPGANVTAANRTSDSGSDTVSGTAVSAALVSGWVARYMGANPKASLAEIGGQLVNNSTKNVLADVGSTFPNRLLFTPVSSMKLVAPSAPAAVTAFLNSNGTDVTVAWSTPAKPGSSPITGYEVTVSPNARLTGTVTRTTGVTNTLVFTGLGTGVAYKFTVVAVSASGKSAPSVATPNISLAAHSASAPTNVTVAPTTGQAGMVTVSWGAPTSDGGATITGYRLTAVAPNGSAASVTTAGSARSVTISGLAHVAYTIQIVALNSVGEGQVAVSGSVTPLGLPSAPGPLTLANPAAGSVSVQWSAPTDNGGSPITGYQIRISLDGLTGNSWSGWTPVSKTNTTYTSLAAGKNYIIQVVAVTAVGMSATTSGTIKTTK